MTRARTTTDINDGLVWVVRTRDMQVRAHREGCQAIVERAGASVALRTPEDKDDEDILARAAGGRVVVCRCVRA